MKTKTANPQKHNNITPCQAKNKTFLLTTFTPINYFYAVDACNEIGTCMYRAKRKAPL
jgi:hypothetical protein